MKIPHVHFPIVSCGFSRSCSTEAPFCKSAAKAAPEARICRTPCSLDLGHNGKIMGKSWENHGKIHERQLSIDASGRMKKSFAWKICSIWFYGKEKWWPRIFHETWENDGKMMNSMVLWKSPGLKVWKWMNMDSIPLYIYINCYFMLFEWGDKQMDLGVHHFQTNPNGKIS